MLGFILSFTFFTLFLTSLVKATGLSANFLRTISVIVIFSFGISLIIPKIQTWFEVLFSKLSRLAPSGAGKQGFGGGFVIGLSLGLLWTPCVGPILASVISLALIGEVSVAAFIITFAYALGTAIPMLLIIKGGSKILQRVPWLTQNLSKIQKGFGVLMIVTAILIAYQIDRKFQTYILTAFPNYGTGLTTLEDIPVVKKQLDKLYGNGDRETPVVTTEGLLYPKQEMAPELILGGEWINSEPLSLSDLRGKVVLIDFWTYTCINCQRTFPYLRTWWEKYEDDGLVIIGVHAPEFEFEKDYDNVLDASEDFELKYPIMQDNNFETWRAYNNRYWPAKYLIDKDGYIRYTHFGEGAYDETEKVIQALLKETGMQVTEEINNPKYANYARTPELYLGYLRMNALASPERADFDKYATYSKPASLPQNTFALDGEWLIAEEYSTAQADGSLYLKFESKDVFLVMLSNGESSQVEVYLDDEYIKTVEVTSDSLYELINMEVPGKHELRLRFLDSNVEVYAFTFG